MDKTDISLISIILPVYNVENYLCNAIDSVIKQTYNNWELIIIDDGSTDNSPRICDNYRETDNRIKVYHNENKGVSYSRNYGLKKARGDYIIFLDSDDFFDENCIFNSINQICDADILIYSYAVFPSMNLCRARNRIYPDFQSFIDDFDILYKNRLLFIVWNKLYRKSFIIEHNISFNENFSLGEDVIFNLDCFNNNPKIISSDFIGYYYRFNKINTLSSRISSDSFSIISLYTKRLKDLFASCPDSGKILDIAYKNKIAECFKKLNINSAYTYKQKAFLINNWLSDNYFLSIRKELLNCKAGITNDIIYFMIYFNLTGVLSILLSVYYFIKYRIF